MADTSVGNRVLNGGTYEYPDKLQSIPFASYMKITRFEYNEGLKRARENGMQGVGSALGNPNVTKIRNAVAGTAKFTFGNFNSGSGEAEAFEKEVVQVAKSQNKIEGNRNTKPKTIKNQRDAIKEVKAGDFSNIEFPIKLQDGTEVKNAEELAQIKNKAHESKDAKSTVYFLPMPNEFSYEYGANWDNKFRLGTMARILDSGAAVGQMLATGVVSGVVDAGGQLISSAGGEFLSGAGAGTGLDLSSTLGAAFKGATNPLGSTDSLNPKNLLGLAGLAPNENAITMFSSMSERKFNLSFEFFARSALEAKELDDIINGFKTGMHPTTTSKGTGGVLGFPDLFMLEPWYNDTDSEGNTSQGGIAHPMMPRSKLCALTGLSVNASPSNNFITTKDGNIPIQTVNMSFLETTALTQSDLETGKF